MSKSMPLSILMLGNHPETLVKLQQWKEAGALSFVGIWEPSWEETFDCDFHIILLTSKKEPYRKMAQSLHRPEMIVLDLDTFWMLELLITQFLELQSSSKDKQLFQTIFKYSHEGIQLVDASGIIQYVNPSFSRITNIPPEERLGKSIYEVSPDGALVQVLQTKTPVIGWKSTGHGSVVEAISNAAPIFVEGTLVGAVTTFQDITEIKHLSLQLRDREQKISDLHDQLSHAHAPSYSFRDIIGESQSIAKTVETARKAARTRSTVLITGESGTGKELFAHSIHAESPFHQMPFVVVNCAAIPAELLESELFGYEKGAFTHAIKQKIGKFELANEGTLFLDEIGDMSIHLQAKLLRVLQSKEIERIGGLKTIKVNVRVIAATNRHLLDLVSEGKFREDLYYRLNVVRLEIPPLQRRIEDLPALVQILMKRISRRTGLNPMTLTNKGSAFLADHHWPGNIRELENFLERLMNESSASVIPDSLVHLHISKLLGTTPVQTEALPSADTGTPILPLRTLEREHIRKALELFGTTLDGKKKAARSLGISVATLYNKIKTYHL